MHKYIMVKVGGKQKTQKVRKNHVNFTKSEGKFARVGEKKLKNQKLFYENWKKTGKR